MFCPNCGTKNDDAATPCKKCGFKLAGVPSPKFRGTMMLNSAQSVQELVEEHRRKMEAEASAPGDATAASSPAAQPSRPPLSSFQGTPKAVFQPPRAGLPHRRVGSTMLGVAPQAGGFVPPQAEGSRREAVGEAASEPAEPLGGTVARAPAFPEGMPARDGDGGSAATPALALTEALAVSPEGADAAATQPARTEAMAAVAGRTEAFEAPPAARTPNAEAPAEPPGAPADVVGQPPAPAPSPTSDGEPQSEPPQRPPVPPARAPGVRPLDVFLIIVTCGLYGLVLWARQSRAPQRHAGLD